MSSGPGRRGRGGGGGGRNSGRGGGGGYNSNGSGSSSQRGGGGGRSSSRGGGKRSNNNRSRGRGGQQQSGGGSNEDSAGRNGGGGIGTFNTMRDEDVLIAFMPYLKGSDSEAARIHEQYQVENDQRAFLKAARVFLERQQQQQDQAQPSSSSTAAAAAAPTPAAAPGAQEQHQQQQSTHQQPPVQSVTVTTAEPSATSLPGPLHHPQQPEQQPRYTTTATAVSPPHGSSSSTAGMSRPGAGESNSPRRLSPTSPPLPLPLPPPAALQYSSSSGSSTNPHAAAPESHFMLHQQQQQQQQQPQAGNSTAAMNMDSIEQSLGQLWQHPDHTVAPGAEGGQLPSQLSFIWGSSAPPPTATATAAASTSPRRLPTPPNMARNQPQHQQHLHHQAQPQHHLMPPRPSSAPSSPAWQTTTPPRPSSTTGPPPGLSAPEGGSASQQQHHHHHHFYHHTPPPPTHQSYSQQQQQQLQQQHQPPGGGLPPVFSMSVSPFQLPSQQQQQQQLPSLLLPQSHVSPASTPKSVSPLPLPSQQQQVIGKPSPSALPQPDFHEREVSMTSTSTPPGEAAATAGGVFDNGGGGGVKSNTTTKKEALQPKRLWTRFDEQPGRIVVNGVAGDDSSVVLSFGPRDELTAYWSLPLDFIRTRRPQATTLEEALHGLTVGLFRRGCTENGSQASIIAKGVMGDDNRSYKYWKDPSSNSIQGKVPFYSPRTPGHVVLRMYYDADPIYTLAMGPGLHVRVMEKDFESSVRFILSNFKGKKYNPTSLSSLHSLALVLETSLTRPNDSAARATFGCIQEARKVIEACLQEYTKTSSKLSQLEETVEELKKQVEEEETKSHDLSSLDEDVILAPPPGVVEEEVVEADDLLSGAVASPGNTTPSANVTALREKTRALLSGRASCERKWRDSQQAFATILRTVLSNPTMSILLRRDLIAKMRLEYELWCPLSEEFAIAHESHKIWYDALRDTSYNVTADDMRAFTQARIKMQMRTLGFDPNPSTLQDVLFPPSRSRAGGAAPGQAPRAMDARAVSVFNMMSAAMGEYYQKLHQDEDQVVRRRELIRQRTETCVQESGVFPVGTRVVIFGSSANGFGSPKSDLDMCLHLPEGTSLEDEEDETGAAAMAKLANFLEEAGMKDVDTARLTARIPIIMFHCVDPLENDNGNEEEEPVIYECDLSMHNPLAVLNTSLLRTYAEITPVTRVLASVIKRWAKARDINNPSRHTLSSYGYIIMLLHFLTYHKRTGNGLVSTVGPAEGSNGQRNRQVQQASPLLPNLHWMDPNIPNLANGSPYKEIQSLPRKIMKHPLVEGKSVNAYFCKPNTPNDMAILQHLYSGQDLSLSILLASFFRYYAFEFDYKRHVVSMHSTAVRGVVEREVKAEVDGWRNYSAALTIEDPFETFYDVAHVLRGGYYHRIRREFTVAYSKIADAASGRAGSWNRGNMQDITGQELMDWLCEPVSQEREAAAAAMVTATTTL